MFRIFDTTTSDVLDYKGVEDFRKTAKFSFDKSAHDAIDELCDAIRNGRDTYGIETFLGIRVVTDHTLDVYDLIDLYC